MFTGIVEEIGTLESSQPRGAGVRLRIRCREVLTDATLGSSIAVNGVCLTAAALSPAWFDADVAPETLSRTNLGELRPGAAVNLERPLAPSSRLGGHMVQGHIDSTGEVASLAPLGDDNWWLEVKVAPEILRYLVFKGSVAIDGISLTIARLEGTLLAVTVVPHTWRNTTLQLRRPGDRVNIECDIIARYVEKMFAGVQLPSRLTVDRLREEGY